MGKQLVLALFADEAAADQAVATLKEWDKLTGQVPLGGIGVLVKDEKGKLKTHKLGARRTAGGAILFGLAAVLTGGTMIGLGLVGGSILGGAFGALFHKGLKISREDMERLNKELDGGKAAVGVMAEDYQTAATSIKLTELGGQPEAFEVSEEALAEAQAAAEAAPDALADEAGA